MKNKKESHSRNIDEAIKKTTKNLGSQFTLISKMEIKAWKAFLAIFFITGVVLAIIISVQTNIHTYSDAAEIKKSEKSDKIKPKYIQDHFLIKFKEKADKNKVENLIAQKNLKEKFEIKQIGVKAMVVPPGKTAPEIVEEVKKEGKDVLEFVELDQLFAPDLIPNDSSYSQQWHHPKINSPTAWDSNQGSGITVAILDSGVDPSHPDLAGKLVSGYNFYSNNDNTADVYGHGTKVAGSAAAIGNNNIGVAGVAWEASIMPIRVTGTDGYATSSTLSNGLVWSSDHGAKVMNMSFSGVAGNSAITTAAQYAKDHGGVVVAAAGNCGCLDSTPENPSMISVSATNSLDNLSSFSSRGNYVDLAAPGENIYTTVMGGGYGGVSGTSFASPVTAGVIALIISAKSTLTPSQIESILYNSALDLGTTGKDTSFGWGRVDAGAAVALALGDDPPPISDTTAPTVSVTSPANGATVSGTVAVSASASDNVGVTRVEFYMDNTLQNSDTDSPYSFNWNTTAVPNGSHTLSTKAYDAAGNIGTSSTVTVTVSNGATDTTPPSVKIKSPINGTTTVNSTKINASATDNVAVVSMKAFLDSAQVCSSTSGSLSCNIVNKKYTKGMHNITVEALDAAGNKGTSSVSVTFK